MTGIMPQKALHAFHKEGITQTDLLKMTAEASSNSNAALRKGLKIIMSTRVYWRTTITK